MSQSAADSVQNCEGGQMAKLTLVESHVHAGVWHGVIVSEPPGPMESGFEVSHLGKALSGFHISPAEDGNGRWRLSVAIPAEVLCDGVQVFLLRNLDSGEIVGHFSILTGEAIAQDALAEIELLRAELDLLKSAFRRHCLESGS
jgi:hypothetical protein